MSSLTTVSQTSPAKTGTKTLKFKVGTRLRALQDVKSPDFKDISFAGWTGKIVEISGAKAPYKYFIEWDESIVEKMPKSYVDRCEEQQIYYRWACFTDNDFEVLG